jgi:ABC-type dipeptide/oligopeptide/nickel transport system permease subunit
LRTSVIRRAPDNVLAGDRRTVRQPRALTPSFLLGAAIVAAVLVVAVAAPLIAPFDPNRIMVGPRLQAPTAAHLFGTDPLGRDLFSRVVYGARIAVGMAVLGTSIAAFTGIGLGLLAGFRGGRMDAMTSRVMDIWLAFPGLLLALVLVARLGPSLRSAVVALGIVGVPSFYRLARSLTLSAQQELYVEAAHAIGASEGRILIRHILPNTGAALLVMMTLRAGILILAGGGLSFLGLGAQPPQPEWGALLAAGRDYMDTAPWLAVFPGLSITLTVLALNLLGDGLRDHLDVRSREDRRAS